MNKRNADQRESQRNRMTRFRDMNDALGLTTVNIVLPHEDVAWVQLMASDARVEHFDRYKEDDQVAEILSRKHCPSFPTFDQVVHRAKDYDARDDLLAALMPLYGAHESIANARGFVSTVSKAEKYLLSVKIANMVKRAGV